MYRNSMQARPGDPLSGHPRAPRHEAAGGVAVGGAEVQRLRWHGFQGGFGLVGLIPTSWAW